MRETEGSTDGIRAESWGNFDKHWICSNILSTGQLIQGCHPNAHWRRGSIQLSPWYWMPSILSALLALHRSMDRKKKTCLSQTRERLERRKKFELYGQTCLGEPICKMGQSLWSIYWVVCHTDRKSKSNCMYRSDDCGGRVQRIPLMSRKRGESVVIQRSTSLE